MEKNEIFLSGIDRRIYSGNYLVAKGYTRAFFDGGSLILEIPEEYFNRRYFRVFPNIEQGGSMKIKLHHTSDNKAVVFEYLLDGGDYKARHLYIGIDNVDYYPHNRTDIKRTRVSKKIVNRGPNATLQERKVFCFIGHRPRTRNKEDFNILSCQYNGIREFLERVFRVAINKYQKENVFLITNGNVGFCQVAQSVAIENGIGVWLHLPFDGYEKVWHKREREVFDNLKNKSTVLDLGQGKIPRKRIKAIVRSYSLMAEKADHIISVYDGYSRDEVAHAIKNCNLKGKRVTNLSPKYPGGDLLPYLEDNYKIKTEGVGKNGW